ncbi:hypothetical protein [Streptomyces hydrogenans]|uniref:hypothetical protein n=1 Tax=Streptomyces hydrogenans TaxID=1873719 RepID=UPI003F564308
MGRVLSPRGAFPLQKVDGAQCFALRTAAVTALPTVPLAVASRADAAVYAMLGSFMTTFVRNLLRGWPPSTGTPKPPRRTRRRWRDGHLGTVLDAYLYGEGRPDRP